METINKLINAAAPEIERFWSVSPVRPGWASPPNRHQIIIEYDTH